MIKTGIGNLKAGIPVNEPVPTESGFGKNNPNSNYDNPYFVRLKPGTNEPIGIDTSGFSGNIVTKNGGIRNPKQFWKAWIEEYPETISPDNSALISAGKSPKVDPVWIEYFPEHSPYMLDTLAHHHLGQGPIAYPLPMTVHNYSPGFGIWHPNPQGQ